MTVNEATIQIIVRKVSHRIGIPLTFERDQDGNLICRDTRGFRYTVVGYLWPQGFVVRGVIRQTRRFVRWSWLCNGQAGNRGRQVGWWQESGEHSFVIPRAELDLPSATAAR